MEKCSKCGHFNSLHVNGKCTYVTEVANNSKEQKLCGCTEMEMGY